MTDHPDSARSGRFGSAAGRWLAVGTFVLGAVAGGVVVGLASAGSEAVPAAAATTEAAAPNVPGPQATGEVSVNAACLRAINDAQDTYGAIDDLADAARTLNAARLDEIIRRLQPLQRRLEQDLRDCQVATRLPDGSVSTGPAPTPTS
ncbi:MAG TPA: hypothetical protein VI357_01375 [Mycobacteriales bacterium]